MFCQKSGEIVQLVMFKNWLSQDNVGMFQKTPEDDRVIQEFCNYRPVTKV